MAYKALPPQDTLLQLLRYDPETGKLYWLHRPPESFATPLAFSRFDTLHAGEEAFTGISATGYRRGRINGQRYTAHRVVWVMVYGQDPIEIDHINGDRTDNRIANLRQVDRTGNSQNRARSRANSSGVTGVVWHKGVGKWVAKIGTKYQTTHLGSFDKFDDAVAARRAAEVKLGYHPNHGRH